jgi:plastocyanin
MFMPMTLTVAVGATVTWKFDDSTAHTVAADDNSFTSPTLANGKTYTHTFTTAGTVKYHCSIHPFMTGTINVK